MSTSTSDNGVGLVYITECLSVVRWAIVQRASDPYPLGTCPPRRNDVEFVLKAFKCAVEVNCPGESLDVFFAFDLGFECWAEICRDVRFP